MEERPRALDFLYLTFKAFLGIAKSTEGGLTKLAALFTIPESTPRVPAPATKVGRLPAHWRQLITPDIFTTSLSQTKTTEVRVLQGNMVDI